MVSFFTFLYLISRNARAQGLDDKGLIEVVCISVLIGLLGGYLFYVILTLDHYMENPLNLLKFWQGGHIFYPSLIAGVTAFFPISIKFGFKPLDILDISAPAIALGHMIARIGCFFAGCCYGKPVGTDFPLGVVFSHPLTVAPKGVYLHPAQIYDATNAFIIFIILQLFYKKRRFPGQIITIYIMLYAVGRFIVECFRGDLLRGSIGLLSTSQFIAVISFAFGIGLYAFQKRKA